MAQTNLPGEILAMTGQAADRLLKLDSGDAALLYLSLLRRGEAESLRWPRERLDAALEQLRGAGLAPSRPWPTRWSGGWARSCPPPT